jgi:hypothetical protein
MAAHVTESTDQIITAYSFTYSSVCNVLHCGTITYELVGGDKSYLRFNTATPKLTLNPTIHSEVGVTSPTLN